MKIFPFLMSFVIAILALPVVTIFSLSIKYNSTSSFMLYSTILNNDTFRTAFSNSLIVSAITAIISVVISFVISLCWFDSRQRNAALLMILVLGLLPPDILAISINRIARSLGVFSSNILFLIYGWVVYCVPFGILVFWSNFYFIENSIFNAAQDIGMRKMQIAIRVILPLSVRAVISCFILCFLLAFNEFPRSYSLAGTYNLISLFLNGQLTSGTDSSIYAGSALCILLSLGAILVLGIMNFITKSKQKVKFSQS